MQEHTVSDRDPWALAPHLPGKALGPWDRGQTLPASGGGQLLSLWHLAQLRLASGTHRWGVVFPL